MTGVKELERQADHQHAWQAKPTLRIIYQDYHRRLLEAVPPGPILDIGGGIGHLKETRPDAVSIDIIPCAGLDAVCDAHHLPFRDGHFAGIVMLDVLHHLNRPTEFLKEAARVLRPGGVLAMIEPGMSPASYPFYRYLHQEPADLGADPFRPLFPDGPKDPFDSNQAIPTLLFSRSRVWAEVAKNTPELKLKRSEWLSVAAFPLSGGFKNWCLMPAQLTRTALRIEDALPEWMRKFLGFRLFVALERTA